MVTTAMFVAAVYFLLPVVWLAISATKSASGLSTTFGLWFSGNHFGENLRDTVTFGDGLYLRWLANSALYSVVGAAAATLLSAMAGYALAKFTFRGRSFTFSTVLAGVLVPPTALAVPLFLMLAGAGVTNTVWSVLLPSMISPFGVYLARVYAAASVPDELLEAGRIDGAGDVRMFYTVSLRLMAPALVTIFLFQFVAIWNNFLLPLVMLTSDRLYPVTLGLYTLNTQISRDPDLKAVVVTGSLLSIIPLILAFLALQRFWRTGLAAGAVKD
ncbi:carbohydrate ABC transporter permease [Amycolatopsis balhimycina DSM 5908]|uniref:Carbohydrate ABC transporter permease n=1 Tax=Amycolatopsis balhimycina DSM 5908 TaxID=1081091 RepID=A0A428WNQ4_AMYBA|nr:carbohydrate ABC transporter permease [Amycolatopsis balhimycina]RSM44683.1 carbohydrate ABC transporter permease [Amycolatopsis balhimycina DSM 5908]